MTPRLLAVAGGKMHDRPTPPEQSRPRARRSTVSQRPLKGKQTLKPAAMPVQQIIQDRYIDRNKLSALMERKFLPGTYSVVVSPSGDLVQCFSLAHYRTSGR